MSTKQTTIDFILDQLSELEGAWARKMFGEYALYFDEKVVALVCDDKLFVKITEPGREYVGTKFKEGRAYPGAKPSMYIAGDLIKDRRWICELIMLTADALPLPRPKKRKAKKA